MPEMMVTRRQFAAHGAALLGGAMIWPIHDLCAQVTVRPVRFVVVNDLHYRDDRCDGWLKTVTGHIRKLSPAPDFCALAGDLSEDGARDQLRTVHRHFNELPIPIHSIIGNHDYDQSGDRREYDSIFGPHKNERLTIGGWEFLLLDSTERLGLYRTRISDDTFRWIDRTLPRMDSRSPIIIVTHFPLGWNWLRPVNAHALLDRFRDHNLIAAFSGHWHGVTERVERSAALMTDRCCSWWRTNHDGSKEKGYALCAASLNGIERQVIPIFPA